MDSKKVRKLLLKYDAGESTLDQEKALREYFQNNDIPDDLQSYRLIFSFAQKSRDQQIDRKMHLPELEKERKYFWTAIAASVILVMGLFFFQNRPIEIYDKDLGTVQDKEEALQKSMEALRMVSQLMNEGKEDLIYLKEFNNTKNKFLITE
jgi:flagellar biosynthesis/type III secretory pathway M-ring protein FliF/YscJ